MSPQLSRPDRQVRTIDDLLPRPDDRHPDQVVGGSQLRSPAPSLTHRIAAERSARVLRPADLAGPRRRS